MGYTVNNAFILGRIGSEPNFRDVGTTEVCTFSVATDEGYTKKDGTKVAITEWHRIESWGSPVHKFLKKGMEVLVQGKIKTEKYQKNGVDAYVTKIVANTIIITAGQIAKPNPQQPAAPIDQTVPIPEQGNLLPMEGDDLPF